MGGLRRGLLHGELIVWPAVTRGGGPTTAYRGRATAKSITNGCTNRS